MRLNRPGYAPAPSRSRPKRFVSNGRSLIDKPRVALSPRGETPRRERCSRALLGQVPDVLELRRQRDDLLALDLVEDDRAVEQAVEPRRTADLAPRFGEVHLRDDSREVDLSLDHRGKES